MQVERANMVLHITRKSNEIFGGFIIGKIIDVRHYRRTLFYRDHHSGHAVHPCLSAVIVGVTNVIPFFGPYIGAIPSTILIALADPLKGLYFLIFIIALQQLDGNVIGPKILGNSHRTIRVLGGVFHSARRRTVRIYRNDHRGSDVCCDLPIS